MLSADKRTVQLQTDEDSVPVLSLKINDSKEILKPWFNKRDGKYYFFLPSFVSERNIYCDFLEENVMLEGKELSKRVGFQWESQKDYCLVCRGREYHVVFMKSANIPALFIETESGSMENINADKEVVELGSISVVKQTKNVEYKGELKKISARGNSTFDNKDKKAYSFTLSNSYPLCGMDAGKKWNLLAMYFEYDKIHTKIVYDMADVLGMEYNIDCTWVDLYCNGNYQGLYLLTEAVAVGEGRVDIRDLEKKSETDTNISGGYLIEKDVEEHLEEEGNGFVTEQCNYPFIIKSPKMASEEEVNYIQMYIQKIEDLLLTGDEKYKEYVDLDSFAKQFLIDKIVLEPDAMNMSTFFYKEANSDILKAGPLWDYDRAFGGALPQYELSIGDYPDNMHEWYMQMYADEEFKEKMIAYYKELFPYFEELLSERIDEYANYVCDSVKMDGIMWSNESYQTDIMSYLEYDSYIKYLKFFLANRLNYLNELWGITEKRFEVPDSSGKEHLVKFVMEDGTTLETKKVLDGNSVEVPGLDGEKYSGWGINEGGKIYSSYIPVYENIELNAQRNFENVEERMAYKLERLHAAADLLSYMSILKDNDFSVCISIDGSSELVLQEEVLTGLKKICEYKHPDWLDEKLKVEQDYFLLIDNGWRQIWDGSFESLNEVNTTFGTVSYGKHSEDELYLYIREEENNYLSENLREDITFVVINRYTGEIVDVKTFG